MKYRLWIYGESKCFRKLETAIKAATRALRYCSNPQVVEIATVKLVFGSPE